MKTVAQIWLYAGIASLFLWICCEMFDITASVEALVGYWAVTFAVACAMRFLERNLRNIWTASAGHSAGTTIIFWAGAKIMEMNLEIGLLLVFFVSMTTANYLLMRKKRQRDALQS